MCMEERAGPKFIKLFMLNSTKHEIYPALNIRMPTIVGILTFISRVNTPTKRFTARKIFIFSFLALISR